MGCDSSFPLLICMFWDFLPWAYIPFIQRKTTLLENPKDLLCFSDLETYTRAHDVKLWRPVYLKGDLKFLFLDVLRKMERRTILKSLWQSDLPNERILHEGRESDSRGQRFPHVGSLQKLKGVMIKKISLTTARVVKNPLAGNTCSIYPSPTQASNNVSGFVSRSLGFKNLSSSFHGVAPSVHFCREKNPFWFLYEVDVLLITIINSWH